MSARSAISFQESTVAAQSIKISGVRFSLFLSEATIQARVAEIGQHLSRTHAGLKPLIIGVLNGSFIFVADLMRSITIPCEIDFCKLSSYRAQRVSSGTVQADLLIASSLAGRHVIVVDDIIDSGLTLHFMLQSMQTLHPESMTVVALLHKKGALKTDVQIDHVGFTIPNRFVVGYGLDWHQRCRNLRAIYMLDDEES